MHTFLLSLHSIVRWVVVLAALLAVGRAIWGWQGKRQWESWDDRAGLLFTISLDIQLVVGLILYVVSPLIEAAFQDFGAAMSSEVLRFFAMEHVLMMVIAVVVAHVGRALAKRAQGASEKHRRAALLFSLAVIILLLAIPWPFRGEAVGRPWLRLG